MQPGRQASFFTNERYIGNLMYCQIKKAEQPHRAAPLFPVAIFCV